MMRLGAILVLIGAAGAALAAAADDQALIQQAAAQRTTAKASEPAAQQPPAPTPENDNLSQAERQARNEANLALAKLELILGRKAMMAGKPEAAARKAQHVLVLLRQLPPEIDAAEYELQAEGILAKAARAGVNVAALARDATAETPLPEGDAALDREVQGAARVARQDSGAPRPDIDNSGDARLLRERTLRRQTPDRYGYRPGREIIDVDAVAAADRQRNAYQEALRAAYKAASAQRESPVRRAARASDSR